VRAALQRDDADTGTAKLHSESTIADRAPAATRKARKGVLEGCKIASERVRGRGLAVLAYHRIAAASVSGFDLHAHDDLTRRIAVSAAAPENPNHPGALAKWHVEQEGIDAKLILNKRREDGVQDDTLHLWFDKPTQQYRTGPRKYPLRFVDFSTQDQEMS
jgi:hypothetical protein